MPTDEENEKKQTREGRVTISGMQRETLSSLHLP